MPSPSTPAQLSLAYVLLAAVGAAVLLTLGIAAGASALSPIPAPIERAPFATASRPHGSAERSNAMHRSTPAHAARPRQSTTPATAVVTPSSSAGTAANSAQLQLGAELFDLECRMCHARQVDLPGLAGPSLVNLLTTSRTLTSGRVVRFDPANPEGFRGYLRQMIRESSRDRVRGYADAMPGFAGILSDEEIEALVELLMQPRTNH